MLTREGALWLAPVAFTKKNEKRGKLIGGGCRKIENRLILVVGFLLKYARLNGLHQKLVRFSDIPPPSKIRSVDWQRSGHIEQASS